MARLRICGLALAAASLLPVVAHAASRADLRIRATMKSFRVGGVGTYNIIISNRGPNGTDDVVTVRDQLPTGINFVSGSGAGWTCAAAAGVVTCTHPGSLDAVSTSSLRLSIGADSTAAKVTVNSITVTYSGDPNPANNSVTKSTIIKPARGPLPPGTATPVPTGGGGATPTNTPTPTAVPVNANETDLSMLNVNNGAFTVGTNGTYTLTVTNEGGDDTNTTITVIDQLPAGLGFVSGSGNGWSCSVSEQTVTCTNPGPLPASESTSFLLTVSVDSTAFPTVTNVATVSYPADTDPSNDTANKPTPVRAG